MKRTSAAGCDILSLLHPFTAPSPPALQSLCGAANEVIEATLTAAANKDPEDEPPLAVVAALYSDKTAGVWGPRIAEKERVCGGWQGHGWVQLLKSETAHLRMCTLLSRWRGLGLGLIGRSGLTGWFSSLLAFTFRQGLEHGQRLGGRTGARAARLPGHAGH